MVSTLSSVIAVADPAQIAAHLARMPFATIVPSESLRSDMYECNDNCNNLAGYPTASASLANLPYLTLSKALLMSCITSTVCNPSPVPKFALTHDLHIASPTCLPTPTLKHGRWPCSCSN